MDEPGIGGARQALERSVQGRRQAGVPGIGDQVTDEILAVQRDLAGGWRDLDPVLEQGGALEQAGRVHSGLDSQHCLHVGRPHCSHNVTLGHVLLRSGCGDFTEARRTLPTAADLMKI
ncbi:Uncharacterised protein [Bordetella pertussis]|nr:Uncharacterised protein [Bordetella pertussis]